LLALEENHGKILRKQADEIQELKDRLTKLDALVQAREDILVAKAEGAAAAGAAMSQSMPASVIVWGGLSLAWTEFRRRGCPEQTDTMRLKTA
jgi:hypothetical protein